MIDEVLSEINEIIIAYNTLYHPTLDGGSYTETDEKGMVWIEKMSLDAYNESDVLIVAAERYFERMGHYPESILAENLQEQKQPCLFQGTQNQLIRGVSRKDKENIVPDPKTEYKDNADRIVVERKFALAKQKQKYGLGLITSRLDETTRTP